MKSFEVALQWKPQDLIIDSDSGLAPFSQQAITWTRAEQLKFNDTIWPPHGSISWIGSWRHQMETFSALLAICAGNSPVTGEFPPQRPVTRSFDVFFDLCLNTRLSKR